MVMTGWTFKKEISISDLITFAMALVGVLVAYFSLDKRVALTEAAIANWAIEQAARERAAADTRREILESLKDLTTRIDRERKK